MACDDKVLPSLLISLQLLSFQVIWQATCILQSFYAVVLLAFQNISATLPSQVNGDESARVINLENASCLDELLAVQVKESLKVLMGVTHTSITAACQEYYSCYRRHVYVTPKSYLSFLEVYQSVYTKKLTQTRAMAAAINSGLQKMNDAKLDVNRMKARCILTVILHSPDFALLSPLK